MPKFKFFSPNKTFQGYFEAVMEMDPTIDAKVAAINMLKLEISSLQEEIENDQKANKK